MNRIIQSGKSKIIIDHELYYSKLQMKDDSHVEIHFSPWYWIIGSMRYVLNYSSKSKTPLLQVLRAGI